MMAGVEDQTTQARGWAVPGSGEAQPTRPPPPPGAPADHGPDGADAVTGVPGGASPITAGAGAVPRVALRPMTAADILDGGFAVVKARPRRIIGIAAGFVVPTQLIAAFLQRESMGGLGIADLFSEDPVLLNEQANNNASNELMASLLVSLIPAIALVCVAAAVAHLVAQWMMGRDAPAGEMLGVVGRRWWALLGSFVIVKLAEGFGLLGCYVGIVFIMAFFVPVAPIIGVEGGGPIEAVKRSARLTRGRYFPTLGIALLMGLVAGLLGNALSAGLQALALWVGFDDGWPLLALGAIMAQVVVLPFVAAATVLLYFDLRVRTEGLDIEMTAIDVLDRVA